MNDVLGGGCPIYHINRTIRETGASFGDESHMSHIIYVNAQIRDDTALGQLSYEEIADSFGLTVAKVKALDESPSA